MAAPASRSRLPLILGLTAAGGVGYYLYTAGGDPKVASKEVQYDASSVSSAVKSEIPGRGKEIKKEGELFAQKAGSKIDSTINDARHKLSEVEAKAESYAREVKKDAMQKVDKFDAKVEEQAAKAKSGLSGWFK